MKDFEEFNNISSSVDYQSYKNQEYNYLQNKRYIKQTEHWLPIYLQQMSYDYKILFSTITFKDTLIQASVNTIQSYLDQSSMRLNKIVCPKKNYQQSCKFLYIPEKTYKKMSTIRKKHECPHIHGFIFIHKKRYLKFLDTAVQYIVPLVTDTMGLKNHFQLIDRVLAPYSQDKIEHSEKFDRPGLSIDPNTLLLEVQSSRIHSIESVDEYNATAKYMTKSFENDFKYDDLIATSKFRPSKALKPKK